MKYALTTYAALGERAATAYRLRNFAVAQHANAQFLAMLAEEDSVNRPLAEQANRDAYRDASGFTQPPTYFR